MLAPVSTDPHRLVRRFPALLLLVAGLAAAVAAGAQAPPASSSRFQEGGPRIWWNQERFVDGLQLGAEQRAKMDAILEDQRQHRREVGQRWVSARQELGEALAKGDWAAAEAARGRIGEAAGEMARAESGLVLEVFRLLDASQRKTIATDFPALLQRPWLMGFGADRQGAGGPRARGRGPKGS